VQNLISTYGYLAVFVLMLAESACIPVPSEVIMLFGGALAAGAVGHGAPPSLLGVVAAGVLGNVAGSYLAWAVGKYAGQAAIGRWGRRIGIREHEIGRAVAWFERHGPVAVLVGRVIPVIRTFISLPAGFAEMPASRFGLYTALGCIPWTAALGIAGYALGANWDQVANDFHGPTYAIAGVLLVAVVVIVVRRRRARSAAQAGSAVPAVAAGPFGSAVPAAMPGPGGYAQAAISASAWAGGGAAPAANWQGPPANGQGQTPNWHGSSPNWQGQSPNWQSPAGDWQSPAANWQSAASDWPARFAERTEGGPGQPADPQGRPRQPADLPGRSAGAFSGQQPPSPYARGAQDAYRSPDSRGVDTPGGLRDAPAEGPQDPWAQPSGRGTR
jgi:membrane protein DedA with SNARE-associated domain